MGTPTNITLSATVSGVTKTVTIGLSSMEIIVEKKLTAKITQPASKNNWKSQGGTGRKDTRAVDLLQITRLLVVNGILAENLDTGDSSNTVEGKKDDLIAIVESGGFFTMSYRGKTDYKVNLDGKLSIKDIVKDTDTLLDGEVGYEIMMTLVEGVDM